MKIITNALEAKIVCIRGFAGGLTVPIQRVKIPIETIKYVKIAWEFHSFLAFGVVLLEGNLMAYNLWSSSTRRVAVSSRAFHSIIVFIIIIRNNILFTFLVVPRTSAKKKKEK